ncbi:hypothetical protein MF271_13290 [Deinococcus sp. KNUC1210]|uniref:hypothetical protein n=1 Tax=Deinococcus sp. KNUC1210 TaxID=2917691 RepID=UPI001EF049C1|nr:hypothetical protein [Deinococcus sp. KNUC1210]ULH14937.1 hypothetical protein MF271_13290 [Deinococcus sp. KNUC1210]
MNPPSRFLALCAVLLAMLLTYRMAFHAFDLILVAAWAVLALATFRRMGTSSFAVQRMWWTTLLLFPIWEFAIKWMVQHNVIAYSWWWLNRLEHFGWMASLLLLLLPIYQELFRLGWFTALLFVLGLGSIIGNLNEFWEFGLRVQAGTAGRGVLYLDTILDMLTNVPGALLAFLIGWRVVRGTVLQIEKPSASVGIGG